MRTLEILEKELKEVIEELVVLCTQDCKLFRQGCLGRNSNRINILVVKKTNLQININQVKQFKNKTL